MLWELLRLYRLWPSGGKLAYPDDASETPDTLQTVFQYEDFNMLWEHATGIDSVLIKVRKVLLSSETTEPL